MDMKLVKLLTFVMLVFGAQTSLIAQTTKSVGNYISGKVLDGAEPVIGATVIIDGTTRGAITDTKGAFKLSGLKLKDTVSVVISFMGYKSQTHKVIVKRGENLLPTVSLLADAITTDEVIVSGTAPIAIQKGDTTQYNAGAYKTNPDASAEDLVNKMPGFTSEDGKLTIGGEEVTQIYVDGKSYFKDDVAGALSSLPANVIESIQLFDEKSDNSRFTGVDDGDRKKTINIVTTAKKKNAYMGDYIAGGGLAIVNNGNSKLGTREGGLYNLKANTNIFQDKNRFTLSLGSNNVNQSATSGNRYYGNHSTTGLNQSTGVRLNYSGEYKKAEYKQTKVGINYSYGNTKSELGTILDRSYFESSTRASENYSEIYNSNSIRNSHSLRFDVESDINEKNKIFVRGWGRATGTNSDQVTDAASSLSGSVTNSALTKRDNKNDSYSAGTDINWMNRLATRHSIALGGNFRFSKTDYDQVLIGNNEDFEMALASANVEKINQQTLNYGNDNSIGVRLNYTYKLGEKSGLTIGYNNSFNWSNSDKKTYLYDELTGDYIDIDEALSNVFDRNYLRNNASLGYSYNVKDKISFSVNAEYQNATLKNNQTFPSTKLFERKYSFNSPTANLRLDYYFSKNSRLGLFFNGRPNLPTVTQLQDVVDNTNPLQITTGNPNLNQSYNSMFGMNYTFSNPEKSTSINAFFFGTNEMNSITNTTRRLSDDEYINGVLVQKGARVSSPVNANGLWSVRSGVFYSLPFPAIKCNFTVGGRYSYSRMPSYIDNVKSFSRENNGMISLKLNSNISKDLDFTLTSRTSLSVAKNSISNQNDNTYIRENIGIKANWIIYKGIFVNVDYSYNFYHYSVNAPEDPNFSMLNAGIGKKMLKNQNLEVRLSGFDLLNQSKALRHTVSAEYVEDSRTNVLQRYLMMTVAYKFNTMKGNMPATSSTSSYRGPRGGMSPMGGGMR